MKEIKVDASTNTKIQSVNWRDLAEKDLKDRVRGIIRTSTTKEEIINRIQVELQYRMTPAISILKVACDRTRAIRTFVAGFTGLMTADNNPVQIMMYGKGGKTLNF